MKYCSVLTLLDLNAAFDSVKHNILLYRIIVLAGAAGSAEHCFSYFLPGRALLE